MKIYNNNSVYQSSISATSLLSSHVPHDIMHNKDKENDKEKESLNLHDYNIIFSDSSINSIIINDYVINNLYPNNLYYNDSSNNKFKKSTKLILKSETNDNHNHTHNDNYVENNESTLITHATSQTNTSLHNTHHTSPHTSHNYSHTVSNTQNLTTTSYIFCNNCGKQGHLFHQCKYPITSNGIILFRIKNNKIEYLMVCRKNSLGFVDLMCGKYPLHNKHYLNNIINEMTLYEKDIVLKYSFEELWKILWGKSFNSNHRFEEKLAKDKFNSLKNGISFNNKHYSLESLINESDTSWTYPEWGFPKGRRNNMEKDLTCALREFEEETGYNKRNIHIIQNIIPYEEIFTGSNYKSYKHKYYVAYLDNNVKDEIPQYQYCEISDMNWFTYEASIDIIRPYNLEKKVILTKINKLLTEYRLYK